MGEDRRRFEALYDAHAPSVLAYALRRTDRATADDVLADVFLVAWRRLEDVPTEPRSWLLGTARKALANHRRSADRQTALGNRLIHERPALHAPDATPADDPAILAALAQLSERDREAVLLVAWDGLAPREAAAALGMRAPTFTMRLSRARRRLAALLEETDADAGPSPETRVDSVSPAPQTTADGVAPPTDPCRSEATRA